MRSQTSCCASASAPDHGAAAFEIELRRRLSPSARRAAAASCKPDERRRAPMAGASSPHCDLTFVDAARRYRGDGATRAQLVDYLVACGLSSDRADRFADHIDCRLVRTGHRRPADLSPAAGVRLARSSTPCIDEPERREPAVTVIAAAASTPALATVAVPNDSHVIVVPLRRPSSP